MARRDDGELTSIEVAYVGCSPIAVTLVVVVQIIVARVSAACNCCKPNVSLQLRGNSYGDGTTPLR